MVRGLFIFFVYWGGIDIFLDDLDDLDFLDILDFLVILEDRLAVRGRYDGRIAGHRRAG